MEETIHISLAPEVLTEIAGIPITNTLVTNFVVMNLLIGLSFFIGRNMKLIPGKVQVLFEILFGGVIDYMEETLESRKLAVRFFPLIMTLFLFIFTANLIEFTPGIGSIGIVSQSGGEHTSEFI